MSNNNNSTHPTVKVNVEQNNKNYNNEGMTVEWSQLSWSVTSSQRQKPKFWKKDVTTTQILDNLSGRVEPGELVALMGASGAGKTSLMNMLAGRVKRGNISGDVTFNHRHLGSSEIKRYLSYVIQEDILMDTLTPKEILKFAAMVALPKNISKADKIDRVNTVIDDLNISKCCNSVVGTPGLKKSLSGGERKRVNIGISLLSDPRVLFLDEPTSGLDTSTALSIVKLLQGLAHNKGKTVISTIHQPNSQIFSLFDRAIILAAGQVVYDGPVKEIVPYLESVGFSCDSFSNPADRIIEIINEREEIYNQNSQQWESQEQRCQYLIAEWKKRNSSSCNENRDSTKTVDTTTTPDQSFNNDQDDAYDASKDFETNKEAKEDDIELNQQEKIKEEEEEKQEKDKRKDFEEMEPTNELETTTSEKMETSKTKTEKESTKQSRQKSDYPGFWTQLLWLIWRASKATSREKLMTRTRVVQTVIMAVLGGVLFWNLSQTQNGIRDRQGALFFVAMQQVLQSTLSVLFVFPKEQAVFLRETVEGFYSVLPYYISKLITDFPLQIVFPWVFATIVFFMMGLQIQVNNYFFVCLVFVLTSLCSSALGFIISSITSNLSQSLALMPMFFAVLLLFSGFFIALESIPVFLRWINWFSYLKYAVNTLLISEFEGLELRCDSNEEVVSSTGERICPYTSGDEVLDKVFDLGDTTIWEGFVALICFAVGLRVIAYITIRLSSWLKKRAQ